MNITIISQKEVLIRDYQTIHNDINKILQNMHPAFSLIKATYIEYYPQHPKPEKPKAYLHIYFKWDSKEPMPPKYTLLTYYRNITEEIPEINFIILKEFRPTIIRVDVHYGIPE